MVATLQCLLECHTLPRGGPALAGCQRLGIQEGNEVVQDIPFAGETEIHFHFSFQAAVDAASGKVTSKGKVVQGPRSDPFIYICWGDRSEGKWVQYGRTKILLSGIPREHIQRALQEGSLLRARIRLTDPKGNPALATLKPDTIEWME